MGDLVAELVHVAAVLPASAVMLGGGVLLVARSARLGRRAYWAGVGLVGLFALLVAFALAHRAALALWGAKRIDSDTFTSLFTISAAVTMPAAALVCVLTVRAAARAQRLDGGGRAIH